MRRYLYLIPACGILVAAALAHGWRTDRWGQTADLQQAAERVHALPLKIGDWDGTDVGVTTEELTAANAAGAIRRRYVHRYNRDEVTILLLCGRPGPISVHPPEVCFGAAGYEAGPAHVETLSEGQATWAADFHRTRPHDETLRVCWAWSHDGNWRASTSPRTEFIRSQVLYKLYLVRPQTLKSDAKSDRYELDLLKELIPSLQTMITG